MKRHDLLLKLLDIKMTEREKAYCKAVTESARAFVEEMKELSTRTDLALRHEIADKTMCDVLYELGCGEGVEIFEEMEKWYE